MSKSWSSFEGQQLLHENWRNFLSEESETAKRLRDRGYPVPVDYWEDAEGQEEPQGSNYPDLGRGLTSDMEGSNSLKLILQQHASFLRTPQKQAIIDVMSQIADDEGIMLELSLKGSNSEQDRIIDSAGTAELLNTISSFGLSANQNKALIKALNYWGRTNSIKFTAPPAPAPTVVDDIEDLSQAAETPEPDEQDDEEEGVASKIKDVGGKIAAMASSDAGKALEGTLDGLSLIPGANIPASIGSALVNLAQGEPKEAALSLLSLIPIAGAAGKLGKFGPVLMKLAPAINTFNKARGASGAKEALQVALKKAGTDISVEDLRKASDSALTMYDKLAGIPGIGDQLKSTLGPYVEPLRNAQEFMNSTPGVDSAPRNPDPPMDTLPITRDQPKDRAVNVQQVRGSGPQEPDPEPEEKARGWAGHRWVPATPENALQAVIKMFAEPRTRSYGQRVKTLKALENLSELGAGLMFKDAETDEVTALPRWIPLTDRDAEPGDMGLPPYYSSIVMPRSLKSVWQRFKDVLNPRNTGGIADTSFDGIFSSDIDPQAIENLEDVIGQMKTNLQSQRKPADAEALQETYDRWQTIAGINQRVL